MVGINREINSPFTKRAVSEVFPVMCQNICEKRNIRYDYIASKYIRSFYIYHLKPYKGIELQTLDS